MTERPSKKQKIEDDIKLSEELEREIANFWEYVRYRNRLFKLFTLSIANI